jgi:hypothetical protein
MRRGRVYRRCSGCGARVTARACDRCGWERSTWSYVVDIGVEGGARQQRTKGGFVTKREAVAA